MTLRTPNNNNVSGSERNILSLIREDMEVYGANGDHIGEVESVYMGASTPIENEMGTGAATNANTTLRGESILDVFADALDDDTVPDVLRARLQHDGFVRIESDGLFSSDRYILGEQIASVSNDRVILNVNKKDLIKR